MQLQTYASCDRFIIEAGGTRRSSNSANRWLALSYFSFSLTSLSRILKRQKITVNIPSFFDQRGGKVTDLKTSDVDPSNVLTNERRSGKTSCFFGANDRPVSCPAITFTHLMV